MVNPFLQKPQVARLTVVDPIKRLFQAIYREQKISSEESSDNVPKLVVSDLISKMSFYYEKIRNSVDYKEEHLLRKNAIERILRRQITIEGSVRIKGLDAQDMTKHLLTELIRATYLPNNQIPEAKIDELAPVVRKYLILKNGILRNKNLNYNEKNRLANWAISLLASDLEERLGRSKVDEVIVDYMYEVLQSNISLPRDEKYKSDKEIQIFIGLHRCYFKFDRDMLGFILFKYFNGNWEEADNEAVEKIAKNFDRVEEAIVYQLDHPFVKQLNRLISRYTVFFSVLRDVIEENPVEVYNEIKNDPKFLATRIKNICGRRYRTAKKKLWRAAIRSIIYILLTKTVFVILLEVPVTRFLNESPSLEALIINVAFPAALLFVIVFFTKMPGDVNTAQIVDGIFELVFEEKKRKEPFKLRKPAARGGVLTFIFKTLYSITFLLSFGAIVWVLYRLGFNWVSMLIFLFFLAFVSFFSIRIRKNSKELFVASPRENVLSLFVDFFYVPIVLVGKWLSEKFSRLNVFVFVLDFIIEAPFKIFVEIAEEWTKYVRERKDEIV